MHDNTEVGSWVVVGALPSKVSTQTHKNRYRAALERASPQWHNAYFSDTQEVAMPKQTQE